MSGLPDYYQVLKISEEAGFEEIRKAFREQAKIWHPDTNATTEAKSRFQLINEAWQVLKDQERRRRYDLRLRYWRRGVAHVYWSSSVRTTPPAYTYRRAAVVKDEPVSFFEKIADMIMFVFLGAVALVAVFFGIYRTFIRPIVGIDGKVGIGFGVSLLALLALGWYYLKIKK